MDFLNDKIIKNDKLIKIAGLVTASLNILLIVMMFIVPLTILSAGTFFYIVQWLVMICGGIVLGLVIYKSVTDGNKPNVFGILYMVAQGISIFTGLFWINKIFAAISEISSLTGMYGGLFRGVSDSVLDQALSHTVGTISEATTWFIMIVLFVVSNIVALVFMAISFKKPFVDGVQVSNTLKAAEETVEPIEKLKLTDGEGKVIYMSKEDTEDMDLTNYTVESVYETANGQYITEEQMNLAKQQSAEVTSNASNGSDTSDESVAQAVSNEPKGPSFFSTKKGKKTIAAIAIAVVAVVAAAIIIPKLLVKEIDLTGDVKITYEGKDGKGRVSEIEYDTSKIDDAEIAYFLKGVRYHTSPSYGLKNGDEITVTTSYYSEETAKRLGVKLTGLERKVKVSGLDKIYLDKKKVEGKVLDKVKKYAETKINTWKDGYQIGDADDFKATYLESYFAADSKDVNNNLILVYKAEGSRESLLSDKKKKEYRLLFVKFEDISEKLDLEKEYDDISYRYLYDDDNTTEGIAEKIKDFFKSYSYKTKKYEKLK